MTPRRLRHVIATICLAAVATACTTTNSGPVAPSESSRQATPPEAHSPAPTTAATAPVSPVAMGTADVPGLPRIGQWMIAPDGEIAAWLGMSLAGKPFREPINVIFVDAGARDAAEAKARLVEAMTSAGYPPRTGHSSGYRGVIGGQVHGQLPEQKDHAFSTHPFEENNNHGRIFGPHRTDGGWVFIGALSRENVDYGHIPPQHVYSSFNRARDELAAALEARSVYQRTQTVPLGTPAVRTRPIQRPTTTATPSSCGLGEHRQPPTGQSPGRSRNVSRATPMPKNTAATAAK
ncbi:hypothetical protein GOARA_063_00750 [Gordonia araii NBRC 100433]|uniref:Lipoprotein n=1 Tax=Gordonia araii NBRC 100433 TaxID=1073574 RepID=G7H4V1_9ACTN|nr:hypothetical protein [Gordonia araii]NNG97984.1 hypothetical protein [Gordonia araii NBRC 100433]GAB10876.1 hypothetical protein GOARA_063_00750 [Gordonia araii NBRC 100433]